MHLTVIMPSSPVTEQASTDINRGAASCPRGGDPGGDGWRGSFEAFNVYVGDEWE